jgi:hypothetical protein
LDRRRSPPPEPYQLVAALLAVAPVSDPDREHDRDDPRDESELDDRAGRPAMREYGG